MGSVATAIGRSSWQEVVPEAPLVLPDPKQFGRSLFDFVGDSCETVDLPVALVRHKHHGGARRSQVEGEQPVHYVFPDNLHVRTYVAWHPNQVALVSKKKSEG